MNAVLTNKPDEFELGLTGILGAAIFELTIGLAIGCFLIKKNYFLSYSVLSRDFIIYLCVIVLLFYYIEMKNITLTKSLILVSLWVIYMIYLILTSQEEEEDMNLVIVKSDKEESPAFDLNSDCLSTFNQNYLSTNTNKNYISDVEDGEKLIQGNKFDNSFTSKISQKSTNYKLSRDKIIIALESESLISTLVKGFFRITSKPWELLLDLFTPKSSEGIYIFIQFFVPLFFIWNVSEIELFILEKLISKLNVPASFLGMTIMSWGNNAPDMFNVASAMAKGMVDLALNAAIASEIHNILLGLGLPWLIYNCSIGKPINFATGDLYAFTLFFFSFFILIFIVVLKFNRHRLDHKFAFFLVTIYIIFLFIISLISFKK